MSCFLFLWMGDIRGRCAGLKIRERWFDSNLIHHWRTAREDPYRNNNVIWLLGFLWKNKDYSFLYIWIYRNKKLFNRESFLHLVCFMFFFNFLFCILSMGWSCFVFSPLFVKQIVFLLSIFHICGGRIEAECGGLLIPWPGQPGPRVRISPSAPLDLITAKIYY